MKKLKSLYTQIVKILEIYYFDPYAKRAYIKNSARAIVKLVENDYIKRIIEDLEIEHQKEMEMIIKEAYGKEDI